MVDEFSAFARMPAPVIRPEYRPNRARGNGAAERAAADQLAHRDSGRGRGAVRPRLMGQALTNLLQNAADAVAMRAAETSQRVARSDFPCSRARRRLAQRDR